VLLLAVGIAGISLSGPLVAVTAAPALAIAFWRNALAAAALLPVAAARGELAALLHGAPPARHRRPDGSPPAALADDATSGLTAGPTDDRTTGPAGSTPGGTTAGPPAATTDTAAGPATGPPASHGAGISSGTTAGSPASTTDRAAAGDPAGATDSTTTHPFGTDTDGTTAGSPATAGGPAGMADRAAAGATVGGLAGRGAGTVDPASGTAGEGPGEPGARGLRPLRSSVVAGGALALHFGLWLPSIGLTSVASSIALVSTTPVWTTLLLRLRGHRPPARVWGGGLVAFAGVLVLSGVDLSVSGRALAGDALALAGGMAMAVYMLAGAEARRTLSTTSYTLVCYGTASVGLLAACLVGGVSLGAGYSAETWLKLLVLTVASQFLGHSLLNRVVRGLGPSVVATSVLLETPGAALLAAVWLGQLPPPAAYPALLLILLGLVLVVRGERSAR
jgi:drug/metabolite transporter (DMT)-like permease